MAFPASSKLTSHTKTVLVLCYVCIFVCACARLYIYICDTQSVKLGVTFVVLNKVCYTFVIFFLFLYHRIATALRVFLSLRPQATCRSPPQCPPALPASPPFTEMRVIALAAQAGPRRHRAL